MFTRVGQLGRDLDAVAAGDQLPDAIWAPHDHELGPALIAAASGKYAWSEAEANGDDSGPRRRRLAAQRCVAAAMFHPGSTHYALLAARHDASATALRDNYRRMIALVHPDTQPVGFPIDAATRVNRAYDVLSDSTKRAAYDLTLQPADTSRTAPSEAKYHPDRTQGVSGRTPKTTRTSVGLLHRFNLRPTRRSLLWLAAALVASAIAIVYVSADTDPGVALVEARPKLEMRNSLGTEVGGEPPGSANARPDLMTLPRSEAGDSALSVTAPGEFASPAQRLSTELSAASRRIIDAVSPMATAASAQATVSPNATTKHAASSRVSPSPSPSASAKLNSLAATPSAYQPPDTDLVKQPPLADPVATKEKADTSPKVLVVSSASQVPASAATTGSAPAETPQRIRAVDVDELLARFASAYESGSAPALAALMSQAMPNRRAMLSEYERVFQETRQRAIRFSQVKHKWIGDQVSTSGLITLTTLSHDGQSTRQNAFLEIDTSLEANTLRVTRLANYAQR